MDMHSEQIMEMKDFFDAFGGSVSLPQASHTITTDWPHPSLQFIVTVKKCLPPGHPALGDERGLVAKLRLLFDEIDVNGDQVDFLSSSYIIEIRIWAGQNSLIMLFSAELRAEIQEIQKELPLKLVV